MCGAKHSRYHQMTAIVLELEPDESGFGLQRHKSQLSVFETIETFKNLCEGNLSPISKIWQFFQAHFYQWPISIVSICTANCDVSG